MRICNAIDCRAEPACTLVVPVGSRLHSASDSNQSWQPTPIQCSHLAHAPAPGPAVALRCIDRVFYGAPKDAAQFLGARSRWQPMPRSRSRWALTPTTPHQSPSAAHSLPLRRLNMQTVDKLTGSALSLSPIVSHMRLQGRRQQPAKHAILGEGAEAQHQCCASAPSSLAPSSLASTRQGA